MPSRIIRADRWNDTDLHARGSGFCQPAYRPRRWHVGRWLAIVAGLAIAGLILGM